MNLLDLVATITIDSKGYESGLSAAETRANRFGKASKFLGTTAKVGAVAITAAATAAVAAGAAFTSAAAATAEYGDKIDKQAQKLGISAQAYQEWDAVLQHSGTSMDSMGAAFKKLANASQDASADQVAAFERIGLSMEQVSSMSTEELWNATISGLQGMEESTERTALATELLGKGAQELGPLFNTTAEETQAMIDTFDELGLMSDESVKAAAHFQDSLQDLQTGFTGLKNRMVGEFLPAISTVMDGLTMLFSGNEQGQAMIESGINGFITTFETAMPKVIEIGGGIMESLLGAIISNLPLIIEGGFKIILGLAEGIASALPELVAQLPMIFDAINSALQSANALDGSGVISALVASIAAALPQLIVTGVQIMTQLGVALISAIPLLVAQIPTIIAAIVEAFIAAVPAFVGAVKQLMTAGANALGSMGSAFISKIDSILQSVVLAVGGFVGRMVSAGVALIAGLLSGVASLAGSVIATASGMISSAVSAVRGFVGAMISAGSALIAGVVSGFRSKISGVVSAAGQIISQGAARLRSGVSQFRNAGVQMIQGLINGVKSKISEFLGTIGNMVSQGVGKLRSLLAFGSPSKLMRIYGRWLVEGFILGMSDRETMLIRQVEHFAARISDGIVEEVTALNAKIAEIDAAAEKRAAEKELKDYEKKRSELQKKIAEYDKTDAEKAAEAREELADLEADWNEKQLQAQEKAQKEWLNNAIDYLEDFADEYESKLTEIQKSQSSLADKLAGYGDLFSYAKTKSGNEKFQLSSLAAETAAIEAYGSALESIQARGVSDELMTEILGMNVDDATKYMNSLLSMSDKKWDDYMAAYQKKQDAAASIAERFYKKDVDELTATYTDGMASAFETLAESAAESGLAIGQALIDGLESKYSEFALAAGMFNGLLGPVVETNTGAANTMAAALANNINQQGGDLTAVLNIDGTRFATAIFKPLQDEVIRTGKSLAAT